MILDVTCQLDLPENDELGVKDFALRDKLVVSKYTIYEEVFRATQDRFLVKKCVEMLNT